MKSLLWIAVMVGLYVLGQLPSFENFLPEGLSTLFTLGYLGVWGVAIIGFIRSLMPSTRFESPKINLVAIKSASDDALVDMIDKSINAVAVVSSHPWLASHWHVLTAPQKAVWVKERRIQLLEAFKDKTDCPMDFLNALQEAQKAVERKAA